MHSTRRMCRLMIQPVTLQVTNKLISGGQAHSRQAAMWWCSDLRVRHASIYTEALERKELLRHSGGHVDLSKDNKTGIATILLHHADKKNAFSGKMMVDLADVVSELEKWKEGKGIIVHGTNSTFCSGADLSFVRSIPDPASAAKMCLFMQNVLTRLYKLPMVSVAVLQGHALGGGAELATACDLRLVTERVSIGFIHIKRGLSPGWGGGARLVQLIGRTKALELLSSARILSWREALDYGLADGVIKEDKEKDLVEGAKVWLLQRLPGTSATTRAAKKVVVSAMEHSLTEALHQERDIFASVWGSAEHEAPADLEL